MKILLVDDSDDAMAVAKTRLAREGHDILCADGGEEGLEIAGRENPDLVLLDVDMPDMNGFEVCRRLKQDAATCSIPVIFLSGSGGIEDRVKGLDLGAVDFVTKPFDAFELRARVRAALRTKHLQDLLRKYALIDPLTELPNRRALDERLQQEWARLLRHGGSLSVIMADIDHFKNVNDRVGHPAGDEVLRQVARRLADGCRESDMPARYGGEEFVVVAPETLSQAAVDFAERLRVSICSRPLEVHGEFLTVTASFGVAGCEGLESSEALVEAADEALYRAKAAGRNCVKAAEGPTLVAPSGDPESPKRLEATSMGGTARSARLSGRAREGVVYALVLIVAMLLTVVGLAGVSVSRVNARLAGEGGDWSEAQFLAFSGAEHAMARINTDANWRTDFSGIACQIPLGRGTFVWRLVDEIDGNLANDPTQAFVILSTGMVRNATYTLRVAMAPAVGGLAYGLSVPSTISLSSGALIDSYNSTLGEYGGSNVGSAATVVTNTTAASGVSLANNTQIGGSVAVGPGGNPYIVISLPAKVTGAKTALTQQVDMPTVTTPTGMGSNTGNLATGNSQTLTVSSDRHVNAVSLANGSTLLINGDVTILADGTVNISQGAKIEVLPGASLKLYFKSSVTLQNGAIGMVVDGQNNSRLQLLGLGTGTVSLTNSAIQGVIVAPKSAVTMSSGARVFGAVVAKRVSISGGGIHQDTRITSGADPVNVGSTGSTTPRPVAWSQWVN